MLHFRAVTTAALVLTAWLPHSVAGSAGPPSRAEVEGMMGLPSEGDLVRGQLDTVGFVLRAAAAEEVVATAARLELAALQKASMSHGVPEQGLVGGVCPHDDHLYAGRVYVHVTERITAPRVILIGVFHKAALWPVQDRLVFDSFQAWHGPWGPVAVDPLRDELVNRLDPDMRVVDNTMHSREHSLEALVPFLARGRPERTVVPILVPHVHWDRLELMTTQLADILAEIMIRRGWQLGRDVAVVVSSDAVHYGPDFDHAPFGTGIHSYEQAVDRDRELVNSFLEGPLEDARLRGLFESLVDPETLDYRVPWCGRFSVPFGLELLRKLALRTANGVPRGQLLRYGTSLSEPELAVSTATRESGLGYTAPSNLHHWVGYAAVGYWLPAQ